MTTNDDIIKSDMARIEHSTIDAACGLLRQYNVELRRYLVVLVAGLCDVSADDMMTNTKNITIVQARSLYDERKLRQHSTAKLLATFCTVLHRCRL